MWIPRVNLRVVHEGQRPHWGYLFSVRHHNSDIMSLRVHSEGIIWVSKPHWGYYMSVKGHSLKIVCERQRPSECQSQYRGYYVTDRGCSENIMWVIEASLRTFCQHQGLYWKYYVCVSEATVRIYEGQRGAHLRYWVNMGDHIRVIMRVSGATVRILCECQWPEWWYYVIFSSYNE